MKNPMHPGEFIQSVYLDRLEELNATKLAQAMNVSASTLNRVINQKSSVSTDLALRLSKALGRSPESWLNMQRDFDLAKQRKITSLKSIKTV